MSQTDKTTDEILDSLTGHEEMWIEEQFGKPIGGHILNPGMYRRALIFVVKRRENVNEDDARNAVMDMQLKDVLEFFPNNNDGSPRTEADEPAVVESGKDETAPEPSPSPSLTSVS